MRPQVFRVDGSHADPVHGVVVWAPLKSLWINGCLIAFLLGAPLHTSISALLVFLLRTYATLLLGHSLGMHRRLIHRSFQCAKPLERLLVYLGVLVGMEGPFGLIRVHDIRDWAQRAPNCHRFFSHRASFWQDALWQLNCRFRFDSAPALSIEAELADDPFYRYLQRTWILQQLPLALLFYALGRWPWVIWGVFGRVFVSVAGHWSVTYLTHNPGPGKWQIPAAGVQASNLRGAGLITMGECWHNNHHAFPESARMGLDPHQTDPGWLLLRGLARVGWVWDLGLPRDLDEREDLIGATSISA